MKPLWTQLGIATLSLAAFSLTAWAQEERVPTAVPAQPSADAKSGTGGGAWGPALTGQRRPLYRLCSNDSIEIDFTFSPEMNQTVSVQPDGYINLRGVPQVYAEGLTVAETEQAIRAAYSAVLNDPELAIVLKDFDRPSFTASGQVSHPGKYELRSATTVAEGLAIAGGWNGQAKHSQVVLFRHVSDQLVEARLLDMKAMLKRRQLGEDLSLKPGDFIYVPQNTISKIQRYFPTSMMSLYTTPAQF